MPALGAVGRNVQAAKPAPHTRGPAVSQPGNGTGEPANKVGGGPPVPPLPPIGDYVVIPPPVDLQAKAQRVALEVVRIREAEIVNTNIYDDARDFQHLGICRYGTAYWAK